MGKETSFQDYLYVLLARKWIVIGVFSVVFGTAMVYTFTATKVYKASATIMIQPETVSGGSSRSSRFSYPMINVRNYCEVLRSKAVAQGAAEILKRGTIDFSFLRAKAPAETLLTLVSVDPITDSEIIKIRAKSGSPEKAAAIANAIVDAFVQEQLLNAKRGVAEQSKFLKSQIPAVEENLKESERKIKEFKEEHRIASLPDETAELAKILAEFDKMYGKSQASYKAVENRLAAVRAQLDKQKSTLVDDITKVSNPYVLQLREELTDLHTSYALYMVQGLSENGPKLLDLKASIEGTKSRIMEETKKIVNREVPSLDPLSSSQELVDNILALEVEMAAEEAGKKALFKIRQRYERKLRSLPESEFMLAQLEREKAVSASAYELLMTSRKYAEISQAGTISNVRVVDRAGTSRVPVKPKRRLNIALGIVVGAALGLGCALLVDYVGAPIKTAKDVKIHTGLPVLGSIPRVKGKSDTPYLIGLPLNSFVSEAYRTLRTNIGFANPDSPADAIVITSTMPKEGKSTVAANLAIAMAQLGKKVLLVDADLRKPSIAEMFKMPENKGLTSILAKEAEISSVIRSSGVENLSLISAGRIPPNPAELLESQQLDSLIQTLCQDFRFVVFDTPPAGGVTDAIILARKLKGALIVVQANKTNKMVLSHTKENFEQAKARILGIVLNKVLSSYVPYGYPHYHSRHLSPEKSAKEHVAS